MKKILYILLVCLINLNAYEYEVFYRNYGYPETKYFIDNNNGKLQLKEIYYRNESSGGRFTIYYDGDYSDFYNVLGQIKRNLPYYISDSEFNIMLKNDNGKLLNDFYLYSINSILNYFYNENYFNSSNYINYNDYELLYNSDGLAVESLVDGVYAGLYNMDEMQFSGNLYNENGDLVLVNGFEPSFFQVLCDKLIGDLHLKMLDAENLIDKSWIFAVALTLAIFYLIARTLKRVLIGKNNKGVENES